MHPPKEFDQEASRALTIDDLFRPSPENTENPQAGHTPLTGLQSSARNTRSPKSTKAALIIELAEPHIVELFCDEHKVPYLTFRAGGREFTAPIEEAECVSFLRDVYYRETGEGASKSSIDDARYTLAAIAQFSGVQHTVWVRSASYNDEIYYDLADQAGRVVRITETGYEVTTNVPVKFYRPDIMKAMPVPVSGGTTEDLFELMNVAAEHRPLVLGWLMVAMRPAGEYFLLMLNGPHGTGKSTVASTLLHLIDPSFAELRNLPDKERDLAVAAKWSRTLVFDNLSTLNLKMSDAFCRMATGGVFTIRALFTNSKEYVMKMWRPVIFTGIPDLAERGDLASRSLSLRLDPIGSTRRDPEEIENELAEKHARILGVLFTGLAAGLANKDTTVIHNVPRMYNATKWATACESGLGMAPNSFLDAYRENAAEAMAAQLEYSSIYPYVVRLLDRHGGVHECTSTEWYELVKDEASHPGAFFREPADWPKTAAAFGTALKRLVPALQNEGISYTPRQTMGTGSKNLIKLERIAPATAALPTASAAPVTAIAPTSSSTS
jgi:hypothetical protein